MLWYKILFLLLLLLHQGRVKWVQYKTRSISVEEDTKYFLDLHEPTIVNSIKILSKITTLSSYKVSNMKLL